ncbi:MAG TPA: Hint domain-containing protein, partial [Acetobacteraceae bacterium]|nr:Hint domain-containing protein [Acetobacteraceae bacterium]
NDGYGIAILDNAHDNWMFNGFVGTDAVATEAIGNHLGGILIANSANHNIIGDVVSVPSQPIAMIVSGNTGNGITLESGTSFTQVLNNIIGFDSTGALLPNTGQQLVVNASTDNTISGNEIACFAAGTGIATPSGPVPVERLNEGDLVLTLDGAAVAVRWIGHRHVDVRRHPAPEKVQPVRIAAHAFARNRPARDLLLSPDHAVFVDGMLIPVRYLINGRSIARQDVDAVQYFHVELDRHDVLLAEGLPTESYLDTDDRAAFANAPRVTALHPDWGRREPLLVFDAVGYAPLRVTGPEVDQVRARLAARSADVLARTDGSAPERDRFRQSRA